MTIIQWEQRLYVFGLSVRVCVCACVRRSDRVETFFGGLAVHSSCSQKYGASKTTRVWLAITSIYFNRF